MNLYLDIDGVILTKDGKEADHLLEFLNFATKKFDCYWLTTHCKGDVAPALEHVKGKVSEESFELLKKLKPTNWQTLKTEAIDFSEDFVWLDDYIMSSEKKVLLEENALFRFHEINLGENPEQLAGMINLDYPEALWCWQRMDLDLTFTEEELESIKGGFVSVRGMDERWRFVFQDETLYIMRHWTGWVNYKLRFKLVKGKYETTEVYVSNLVSENKTEEATFFEKNYNGALIIWLIENYLLHNSRMYLVIPQWFETRLKIGIDSIHGYSHWKSVEKAGCYIADKNGADKKVISCFSFLHDIGRTVESEEPGHGEKSAEIIKDVFDAESLDLNSSQYEKLLEAVSDHDKQKAESEDITVQTCWDADRLDLPRVHVIPDKDLLYTEVGKSQETLDYLKIG